MVDASPQPGYFGSGYFGSGFFAAGHFRREADAVTPTERRDCANLACQNTNWGLYDLYKNDWRYVDEIAEVGLAPIGENGAEPNPDAALTGVKAHRRDFTDGPTQGLSASLATSPSQQGWIVFADTMGCATIEPGAQILEGACRFRVDSARLAVFDTRYLCQCTLLPALS